MRIPIYNNLPNYNKKGIKLSPPKGHYKQKGVLYNFLDPKEAKRSDMAVQNALFAGIHNLI